LSVGLLTNEVRHAASSHGGEFKRKKRMHFTDERLSYVQKLDMKCAARPSGRGAPHPSAAGVEDAKADRSAGGADPKAKPLLTTTEKPLGFWCSPFYLRINPMNYFYCKLTGRSNLHFF